MYRKIGREFAAHGATVHAAFNYVNLEGGTIHTNTVEGAFSIFKRGMRGVYQPCAEHHLHRYLAEFEFRYNNRVALALVTPSALMPCSRCGWQAAHLPNS